MNTAAYLKLVAAGLTVEQIAVVMDIVDESEAAMKTAEEARKSVARERVQRWRDKQKADVTLPKHNGNATLRLTGEDAHVEDNLPSKKITGKEENKKTPRDELAAVLDAERTEAVIEHRNKLRKPLTAYAAKQLAASFSRCPDANAAADMMVESGWLKVKPEWLADSTRRQHGPPNGKRMNAVEAHLSRRAGEYEHSSRTIDYRDAELLPPDKPGLPSPVVDLGKAFSRPFGSGNR